MTNTIAVSFILGVIVPLTLIYMLEAIGLIHFENKMLPAFFIILGAFILVAVEESSKIIFRMFKKEE